jgi:hypothetical protein
MFQPVSILLLISGLLLASCRTEKQPSDENQVNQLATNNGFSFQGISVPPEVMLQVFSHLPVTDIAQASQVCRGWYALSEEPILWRIVRLKTHGDYPASDATKQQAKKHRLRVHVNTLSDLTTIAHLVHKYKLNQQHPFDTYRESLAMPRLYNCNLSNPEIIEEYIAQGNEISIWQKTYGLANAEYGYEQNPQAAVALNEPLVEQGNQEAIRRKIQGLADGSHGYERDPIAAVALNEPLVEQGNEKAIHRKIEGLGDGEYGYERNLGVAVALNESLVEQGNEEAIHRKIEGLADDTYGYERNLEAAVALNESLVGQDNQEAILRKIEGLANGIYGYERDSKAAVALNEALVKQRNEKAILIKIRALAIGLNVYAHDPQAAVILNDSLIRGLAEGVYGYEKNLTLLKSWIEQEAANGKRWACYLKAQGLKYGILSFEKDRQAAIQYILDNNIPY